MAPKYPRHGGYVPRATTHYVYVPEPETDSVLHELGLKPAVQRIKRYWNEKKYGAIAAATAGTAWKFRKPLKFAYNMAGALHGRYRAHRNARQALNAHRDQGTPVHLNRARRRILVTPKSPHAPGRPRHRHSLHDRA